MKREGGDSMVALDQHRSVLIENSGIRYAGTIIAVGALYSILFDLYTYIFNPPSNITLTALVVALDFIIAALFFFFVSLDKYLYSILVPAIFLVNASASYFVRTLKITISQNIMGIVLESNIEEAASLLGASFWCWMAVHLMISIAIASVIDKNRIQANTGTILGLSSVALIIALLLFSGLPNKSIPRQLVKRNLQASLMSSLYGYARSQYIHSIERIDISDSGCTHNGQDLALILILGESARSDHFHINGYTRQTTPLMEKENVVSFTAAYSSFSFTRKSVPCIITRATADNYDLSLRETSFISAFRRVGFQTAWISNQREHHTKHDTTVSVFTREAGTTVFHNPMRADQGDAARFDEELLPYFSNFLGKGDRRLFVILHTIGSHWLYNAHYPPSFARFTPVATNKNPTKTDRQALVNSYDNTILYTDYFISSVIEEVRKLNSLVIYVSDHGEFLGENGRYLHVPNARFTPELFHIPLIIWASPEYRKRNPEKYQALINNKNRRVTHDNIFHSVLDGADIDTPLCDKRLSVFRPPD